MKKEDLRAGMYVRLRNNSIYLVITDYQTELYGKQKLIFINADGFLIGETYDNNLIFNDDYMNEFDVIEVFKEDEHYLMSRFNKEINEENLSVIWNRNDSEFNEDIFILNGSLIDLKAIKKEMGYLVTISDKCNNIIESFQMYKFNEKFLSEKFNEYHNRATLFNKDRIKVANERIHSVISSLVKYSNLVDITDKIHMILRETFGVRDESIHKKVINDLKCANISIIDLAQYYAKNVPFRFLI